MPKSENIFTGRALARSYNISEGAIRNAHKRGELVRIKLGVHAGKYDISKKINKEGLANILRNTQSGDKRPRTNKIKEKTKPKTKKKQTQPKIKKEEESILDIGTIDEQSVFDESFDLNHTRLDNTSDLSNLRILKEREIIRGKQLANEELRGKLIDKKVVANIFNKLWSIDTSQLVPLATKIAPELASICGVEDQEKITKIREKLDKEIWRILGSCKRLMNEHLSKINIENLE